MMTALELLARAECRIADLAKRDILTMLDDLADLRSAAEIETQAWERVEG